MQRLSPSSGDIPGYLRDVRHESAAGWSAMTERTVTAVSLVALVIVLASIGVARNNVPALTLAAAGMTGMFAWLQAPKA